MGQWKGGLTMWIDCFVSRPAAGYDELPAFLEILLTCPFLVLIELSESDETLVTTGVLVVQNHR